MLTEPLWCTSALLCSEELGEGKRSPSGEKQYMNFICSHNYSSEWKSLLPGLAKTEGSVSPAVGHLFPSVVHSPLLKEIKAINSIKYISFSKFLCA